MHAVIVRFLSGNAQPLEWIIAHDHESEGPHTGSYNDIAALKLPVILIAPALDVLLLELHLPAMKKSKRRQMIPFAVEEQLSDDLSTYHFALPAHQSNVVAVVTKEKMHAWIQPFIDHKIELMAIVPEMLCLAAQDNAWIIACVDEVAIIRSGVDQGFAIRLEALTFFLECMIDASHPVPSAITVYNYTGKTLTAHFPVTPIIENRERAQFLQDCITHKDTTQQLSSRGEDRGNFSIKQIPLNLLQGEFRLKKKEKQVQRLWALACGLFCVALLLTFVNRIILITILHHQNNVLNEKIDAIYKQNFPGATSVVSPRFRLDQKLRTVISGASGSVYLDIVARLGFVMQSIPTIKLIDLHYAGHSVNITITAPNFNEIKTLVDKLGTQDLMVHQQNATTQTGLVKVTLQIKEST